MVGHNHVTLSNLIDPGDPPWDPPGTVTENRHTLAAKRRYSRGTAMHSSVRLHGLQSARKDVGESGGGLAGDEGNQARGAGGFQPV